MVPYNELSELLPSITAAHVLVTIIGKDKKVADRRRHSE